MGCWASHAITKLQAGEQVSVTPHGHSMKGKVDDGDAVLLAPVPFEACTACKNGEPIVDGDGDCDECAGVGKWPWLDVGDIVLVKVRGNVYLHQILKMRGKTFVEEFQIGNNRGGINGWVNVNKIYGVALAVAGKTVKTLPEVE